MVELRPVTKKNFEQVIKLEVSHDQQRFVASNLYSIAESKIYPECIPLSIYDGEKMVGFIMYAFNPNDDSYWVCRLMIDRYFQGRGYGSQALKIILNELKKRPDCSHVKLSIDPGNEYAERLYRKLGFEKTGEIVEGEEVMCLEFDKN